jgi:D-xylose transport system permease protein
MATTEPQAPTADAVESPDALAPEAAPVVANPLIADTLGEYLQAQWRRIRSGDSGMLPVIIGLVLILIVFQTQNSKFLSAQNLVNLIQQGSFLVIFGMAELFVLLLGEIDLSIGFNAGFGAVIMAEFAAPPHNVNWFIAAAIGVAACTLVGLIQGLIITRLNLPAFIVTLASYLALEGAILYLLQQDSHAIGGVIDVSSNRVLNGIIYSSMSDSAGWIVMIIGVGLFALLVISRDVRRRQQKLTTPPMALTAIKVAAVAVVGVGLIIICNHNRGLGLTVLSGVPYVVLVLLGLLVIFTFLLTRTRWGRYVYAIGGNAEAARRAGIQVKAIRTSIFALAGFTAGIAGVVLTSYLGQASSNVAGGTYVLYAVAIAVLGGTSLFGGRGRIAGALLGGLIIAAIQNGMGLLGLSAALQYMVQGGVLLAAIIVDAATRRGRTT